METSRKYYFIIGLIFTIILAIIVFNEIRFSEVSKLPKVYSIGTVNRIGITKSSGTTMHFTFQLNGSTHKAYNTEIDGVKKWDRFIVEVPIGEERMATLLVNYPVPDGVEAPTEGWKEIPTFK